MKRRAFLVGPAAALAPAATFAPVAKEPVAARPRLYFNQAAVTRLRARIAKEPVIGQRGSKLVERAEALTDARLVPETMAEEGGGQHANYGRPSGQISEMGLTLGLVFHVTGEKRFAEKLRETMLAYVEYKRWGGQGLADRVPPWHSELNTARFCFGYGCGYDAVHGFLPAPERKKIAEGMVRVWLLWNDGPVAWMETLLVLLDVEEPVAVEIPA